MATITKLPKGKYRAQVRRQGVYKAQSFSRKIDAQGWAVEIERAIEGGHPPTPPYPFVRKLVPWTNF